MSDVKDELNKNIYPEINNYVLREKLGTGSYGVVYKVINKVDKNTYVMKQISLFNMDKTQIDEVKNESIILSALNSTYVTKYYDSFIDNNCLNIIMEYCDGGDLGTYLKQGAKLGKFIPEEKIWKIFVQICMGLNYIHSKKILHRDLKTMNIFLMKENEQIRIGDLGVAKALNQNSFANTFVGTPYYLSPEICEEKPYNEKSDVWALGCILYEMATYKHPFNATNQGALILKILKGTYEPISCKDYSIELKKTVDFLLDKIYTRRPSVKEILKNPNVLKKIKQFNLMDVIISEGFEIGKKPQNKQESSKDLVNLSNNNLNVSNLNLEKFKKMSQNDGKKKQEEINKPKNMIIEVNSNFNDGDKKIEKEKLVSNIKKQQINSKKIGQEMLIKNFQNRPISRAIDEREKDKENIVSSANAIANKKPNNGVKNLSPVNIRKSENFKKGNFHNFLSKDKEIKVLNELEKDKIKKKIDEVNNYIYKVDINIKKKDGETELAKITNYKSEFENMIPISQMDKKNENQIRVKSEYKSTDSSLLYYIKNSSRDKMPLYLKTKETDILNDFVDKYNIGVGDNPLNISKFTVLPDLNSVDTFGNDSISKNTAYFLKDKMKATEFLQNLNKTPQNKDKFNIIIKSEREYSRRDVDNKKASISNKNLEFNLVKNESSGSNNDNKNEIKLKIRKNNNGNTGSQIIGTNIFSNVKKENLVFENNFMKNIKIDEKKIDLMKQANKINKTDNKLGSLESKKENVMRIPKVFQMKYNNLSEKKSSTNNSDNNTKISSHSSCSNIDIKLSDIPNNKITEENKEKNDVYAENKTNEIIENNITKQINLLRNDKNNIEENLKETNKSIPKLKIVPKINSIIKKRVDIIDNVPLVKNNDIDNENNFEINVINKENEINLDKDNEKRYADDGNNELVLQTFYNKKELENLENVSNNNHSNKEETENSDSYYEDDEEEEEYDENEEGEEDEENSYYSNESEKVIVTRDTNKEKSRMTKFQETKERSLEKMKYYKSLLIQEFGEEKTNMIFSFYDKKIYNITENSNNNDLLEELSKIIKDTFPDNSIKFFQILSNYVYYDVLLQNFIKEPSKFK